MENLTTDSLLGKVLDIHVCVCGQLLQHWLHLCLKGTLGPREMMRIIGQIINAVSYFSHILERKHPILKLQQQHTCCQGRGQSSEGTWPR